MANIFSTWKRRIEDWLEDKVRPEWSTDPVANPLPLEPFVFPLREQPAPPNRHLVIDFGTTATVAALANRGAGDRWELLPLVGKTEQTSELVLSERQDTVVHVGHDSYEHWKKQPPGTCHYYESLKRYMDILSRQATPKSRDGFGSPLRAEPGEIVRHYLRKSMEESFAVYRTDHPDALGVASRIIISVPNSFNPTAVGWIVDGVRGAIEDLGAEIERGQIRVIRESDAVGYAVLRSRSLASIPSGDGSNKPLYWVDLAHPNGVPSQPDFSPGDCYIVLDVGGGTTDLTLFRVDSMTPESGHVEFNCGVPIGGSDIDKLVLGAHLPKNVKLMFDKWSDVARRDPLRSIRKAKDATSGQFFFSKERDGLPEDYQDSDDVMNKILEQVPRDQRIGGDSNLLQIDRCSKKLDTCLKLSIRGLMQMIPEDVLQGNLKGIYLTGRGSQLTGIRRAVSEEALRLKVPVFTLENPYHLKLIVSCGMALVRPALHSSGHLPCGTFGRRLFTAPSAMLVKPGFPVSGEVPTLFRVRLRRASQPEEMSLFWWELRACAEGLEDEIDTDTLERIGIARLVATTNVEAAGVFDDQVDLHFLWSPASEAYYSSRSGEWYAHEPRGISPESRNNLTGLPLGWPYHPLVKGD